MWPTRVERLARWKCYKTASLKALSNENLQYDFQMFYKSYLIKYIIQCAYSWVWQRDSKKYLNLYANGLLAASGDGSPPQ